MATEKRLIDANALIAELDKFVNPMPNKSGYDFLCGMATAITEIEDAPTVDAVEVVRCKDCENCYTRLRRNGEVCSYMCDFHDIEIEPDDFCSYGERRAEDG